MDISAVLAIIVDGAPSLADFNLLFTETQTGNLYIMKNQHLTLFLRYL